MIFDQSESHGSRREKVEFKHGSHFKINPASCEGGAQHCSSVITSIQYHGMSFRPKERDCSIVCTHMTDSFKSLYW